MFGGFMNNFVKGMAMGVMAGAAMGAAAEMWMLKGSGRKYKVVKKGRKALNELMD